MKEADIGLLKDPNSANTALKPYGDNNNSLHQALKYDYYDYGTTAHSILEKLVNLYTFALTTTNGNYIRQAMCTFIACLTLETDKKTIRSIFKSHNTQDIIRNTFFFTFCIIQNTLQTQEGHQNPNKN